MWKRLSLSLLPKVYVNSTRTFLSEAYKCTEVWNQRLTSPALQNINAANFYYELEQKFHSYGKVSAIDVDILASTIAEGGQLDALSDIIHKHRLTEETSNTLDSTGHALIRAFLDRFQISELLEILDDRINYGIFLDDFTANLSLHELIKNKDYKSAARIATLLMLQEDFDHKITKFLSLYACVKHLQKLEPVKVVEPEVPVVPATKKKVEIVKVRVKYLRNEYFDDHFDLRDENALLGKTFLMLGELIPGTVGNSAQLLGFGLYGKYEQGIEFLAKVKSDLHTDAIELLKTFLERIKDDGNEHLASFRQKVNEITGGSSSNFEKDVCDLVNAAVAEVEAADIEKQKKIYGEWCEIREQKLKEELERLNRNKRLEDIKQITESMAAEEQKLWFFENRVKIGLQIDSKKVFYHKRWFGKKKKPKTIDEGYVPPDVQKRLG
ncbi:28S ribosomal protein S27, mitochondrial [Pseudolycoriella hygida]|uniref:28S ribosomal protein S27, mitochondrial n=1 Tax=Pseudolycoriella hygida TaxID=35572 RepID=A0A9Q0NF05_9DIPT|nr:28S ribosomal protein S27, mitochondrial [Pseudolycoriella hygida]